MKKLFLVLVLFATAFNSNIKAQAPSLSIGQIYYTYSDSVFIGANYSYTVSIINSGNAVFNNNIVDLYFSVDSAFGTNYVPFDTSLAVIGLLTSIPVGDSVVVSGTYDVNSSFSVGNNTVVIWPLARMGAVPTIDSLAVPMYVNGSILNTVELMNKAELKLYPNPSSENIYCYNANKYTITKIYVHDLAGRLVKQADSFPVNLFGMEPGIYFVDVVNDKNQIQRFKIIKGN